MKYYIEKNLIAWDMAICALWPWSKERETISGYLGINYPKSIFAFVVNWIFYKMGWWPDTTHCSDVSTTEEKIFKDENL